jgi:Tfp pilus assembly protein PilN
MTRVNLLPDSYIAARRRVRRRRALGAGGAAVLLVCAAWSTLIVMQLRAVSADISAAQRELAAERARIAEFEATRKEHAKLTALLNHAARLELPVPATAVLARLVRHLPDTLVLERLSLASAPPDGVVPLSLSSLIAGPKADAGAIRLEIDGVALSDADVARLVGDLSHDKLFANVKLARGRYITIGGVPRFGFLVSFEVRVPADPGGKDAGRHVRPVGNGNHAT